MNLTITLFRHSWRLALLCCSFLVFASSDAYSQAGCTDTNACNYDPGAVTDDGSCEYTGYFIPLEVGAGPAIQACSAPSGYYLPDQDCVSSVIENDPYCLDTEWDSFCEDAYNDCLGCEVPSWFIPIDISDLSEPVLEACSSAGDNYYAPDNQECVESVIAADGYCTATDWDELCQGDFNDCIGCSEPAWFIPVEINGGPAQFACSAPAGYWQPDQECAIEVIASDPVCVETSWDFICNAAYNSCLGCESGAAWFIPIVADNSLTPQYDCSGEVVSGYWQPDQACVVEVILNDSWCLNIGWDAACQSALETCLGCDDGAWFIPVEVSSGPAVFGCSGDAPGGYWEPDQECVTQEIANDSYCLYTSWDLLCQNGYNTCAYGCSNAQWYIPSELGSGQPAILDCSAPAGYEVAESQACVIAEIAQDDFCVEVNWDSLCQSGYDACTNGCTYAFACNYDPQAIYDDGSCGEPGCTDSSALNYNPDAACDDDSCVYGGEPACPGDFDGNSVVATPDLLTFLGLFGSTCP
ncbi:hypothetical protein [Halocola ammonii]